MLLTLCATKIILYSGGFRICQGETVASAWSVSLNGGLGVEPPAGSRGRALGGGSGGFEAESFLSIFIQKGGQKLRI